MNVAPNREGVINASWAAVLREWRQGINATFKSPVAEVTPGAVNCSTPVILTVPLGHSVDYILLKEDLTFGQRVLNYTVEYQVGNGTSWKPYIDTYSWYPDGLPPSNESLSYDGLGDVPSVGLPKDSRVGLARIDAAKDGVPKANITAMRFRCLASRTLNIHLKTFAACEERVPWES